MADHKPNLSHDVVSDFLRTERFEPTDLWTTVKAHLDDASTTSIIVDDSVQDKPYSFFIDLVKNQYSAGPPVRQGAWYRQRHWSG